MTTKTEAQTLQFSLSQAVLFNRITNRIRQSLELQEILAATVTEVRSFLGTDRVVVYQFHPDSSGKVIAESVNEQRLPSLLGLNFPADDIPLHHRELLLKTRQRSIVDVPSRRIGVSPLDCPITREPLARVEICYREADPCHIEYLTAMGVQSSLVVPILHQNMQSPQAQPILWGILVSHHAQARFISEPELQVVQRVADQVSIAIAQASLLHQARAQAQREATLNRIVSHLHGLSRAQFQAALEEAVAALQGLGGRLYLATEHVSELYTCGTQPMTPSSSASDWLEQHPSWQDWVAAKPAAFTSSIPNALRRRPCAVSDLGKAAHLQDLRSAFEPSSIRSILTVPLYWGEQPLGYLTVFRSEICTETLWAGQISDRNGQAPPRPRSSFDAWREVKTRQAHLWTDEDLELAEALNHHFSSSIQQYSLYQQVQGFNAHLEQEVQARTAELQQSWKVDRALKQITNQIRRTLDLQTLLRTIVREVLTLLDTDRVMVYQFTRGWQGEVVIEAIAGGWMPLLGKQYQDECFPQGHARLYQEGRIRVIDDVAQSNLSSCHIQFLLDIQVQANLVVPIRIGTELWGLLIAHECRAPRSWQSFEVDLLQQLADQAAIAIQQAELFEQSRETAAAATAQAQQLEQALQELQQTQTQLIQTEKMSSLGQLVAGVAHEINNPINFIYGNITHVNAYVQDLLKFVHLFTRYYSDPVPELQAHLQAMDLDFLAEDLPKILKSMQIGADRIRQIVLSLRNFSRLDEAEKKPVDIHEGIDNTLLILQHRLKARGDCAAIEVIKNYGDLPLVECYAGQLNQVFMNVISNAIEAVEEPIVNRHGPLAQGKSNEGQVSPDKPQIRIQTTCSSNDQITIEITDNGPGIPEFVRSRLFDPFFTTKPVGRGTGLGLSISYQIVVDRHGGKIGCDSEPGRGTTFWIKIPIRQDK